VRSPVISYRAEHRFPVLPEVLWGELERIDEFEVWWRWLDDLRLDGDGLVEGSVLRGVVSPPVPYHMRVEVVLVSTVRASAIDAEIHGDLEGWARLAFHEEPGGSRVAVAWSVEMLQRPMRIASRVGLPVLQWGHDRVVDLTVAGFRRHLAARGLA